MIKWQHVDTPRVSDFWKKNVKYRESIFLLQNILCLWSRMIDLRTVLRLVTTMSSVCSWSTLLRFVLWLFVWCASVTPSRDFNSSLNFTYQSNQFIDRSFSTMFFWDDDRPVNFFSRFWHAISSIISLNKVNMKSLSFWNHEFRMIITDHFLSLQLSWSISFSIKFDDGISVISTLQKDWHVLQCIYKISQILNINSKIKISWLSSSTGLHQVIMSSTSI